MRPRILHDLSRNLAIRLEEGIRGGVEENPVPVYLCHPLDLVDVPPPDPVEGGDRREQSSSGRAVGALYLCHLAPDARYRQAGKYAEPSPGPALPAQMRRYGAWIKARFVFVVAGGTHEEELGALSGALQTLHALPFVDLAEIGERDGSVSPEVDVLPVEVVDDPAIWRQIGMAEHRLAVVFEVSLPLSSPVGEPVGRVVDREIGVDTGSRENGGRD